METEKIICDRCGEMVFRRNITIDNVSEYNLSNKVAYINSIVEINNVSVAVARSWAEHGLFEQCESKQGNCPNCSNVLKSWQAKYCLECKSSFEKAVY